MTVSSQKIFEIPTETPSDEAAGLIAQAVRDFPDGLHVPLYGSESDFCNELMIALKEQGVRAKRDLTAMGQSTEDKIILFVQGGNQTPKISHLINVTHPSSQPQNLNKLETISTWHPSVPTATPQNCVALAEPLNEVLQNKFDHDYTFAEFQDEPHVTVLDYTDRTEALQVVRHARQTLGAQTALTAVWREFHPVRERDSRKSAGEKGHFYRVYIVTGPEATEKATYYPVEGKLLLDFTHPDDTLIRF